MRIGPPRASVAIHEKHVLSTSKFSEFDLHSSLRSMNIESIYLALCRMKPSRQARGAMTKRETTTLRGCRPCPSLINTNTLGPWLGHFGGSWDVLGVRAPSIAQAGDSCQCQPARPRCRRNSLTVASWPPPPAAPTPPSPTDPFQTRAQSQTNGRRV